VLAVRAYVKAHASKRAIRVRERAPNIVECVPNSSSREDNVGPVVFRPDLLIGLSEGDVASRINGEKKEHQVHRAAHCASSSWPSIDTRSATLHKWHGRRPGVPSYLTPRSNDNGLLRQEGRGGRTAVTDPQGTAFLEHAMSCYGYG
jgi:hypothetical protein